MVLLAGGIKWFIPCYIQCVQIQCISWIKVVSGEYFIVLGVSVWRETAITRTQDKIALQIVFLASEDSRQTLSSKQGDFDSTN